MVNINYFAAPGVHHALLNKLTHKGVTSLKNSKNFKSRVSGSRTHFVLPDGTLVTNRGRELLKGNLELKKEKKPASRTEKKKLSTNVQQREYFVNEKVISARVYSYVLAMKAPILHMVTISFPSMVTDDQGFQYLNTWLTVAKQSLHLRDHLYVAERQQNGTVHFHIMVPQYFNIVKANRAMSVILRNEVRKGNLPGYSIFQAKKYNGVDLAKDKHKKVTNFADPRKRKNLVAYITKYVSKGKKPKDGETGKGFKHLAWHNSRGFSSMFTGICLTEMESRFLGIRSQLNFERWFKGEFFDWLPWSTNNPNKLFSGMLRSVNREVLYQEGGPEIKKKLIYMNNEPGAPGWDKPPVYRKYSEDSRQAAYQRESRFRRPKTEEEKLQEEIDFNRQQEYVATLPTFDEWKQSQEIRN